jgi:tRNA dimethylallyltransferase
VAPVIHVLTGCTAVGKTELALRWAEARGAEIVSCDSLLFYRGADIGTAKPTPEERRRVPHHLIDVAPITAQLNVARYVELARAAVAAIHGRGREVLVTGGSGFYLKAFFGPVADDVEVSAPLRDEVRAALERDGLEALVAELQRLNPGGLGDLDVRNPRRVTRALERCRASGRTLAEMKVDFDAQPSPFAGYEVRLCELVREPVELDERIARRVDAMLAAGLVAEVHRLLAEGLEQNPSAAGAIGYRETIDFIAGRLPAQSPSYGPESDLAVAITRNTRALVKKQRTWFKTQLPEHRTVAAASGRPDDLFPAPV